MGFVLGAQAVLLGCSQDDEGSLDDVCDIRESRCQKAVFKATAAARGQEGATMPPVETLSVQEFSEMLDQAVEESPEGKWDGLLSLLNLLPEGMSSQRVAADLSLEGVAAFYDPRSKRVSVIDRDRDFHEQVFILAHEFAHALQDMDLNLLAFDRAWSTSFDSSAAVHALIEGEAMVYGYAVLEEALIPSGKRVDWARATSVTRESFFATVSASSVPLFAAEQLAPYSFGLAQLAPLWLAQGQAPLDALYVSPSLSLLDWTEDTKVTKRSRVEPLDCYPSAGPAGFVGRATDTLGPLGVLAVLLRAGAPVDAAWAVARGYRGDRMVAFEEESEPSSRAVAWRIRFASEALAEEFVSTGVRSIKPGTALDQEGREALYFGTTLAERLSPWKKEKPHCGTEAELPKPETTESANDTMRVLF